MGRNIDLLIATTDICNYYSVGLNSKQIRKILNDEDKNISIDNIENTINNEYDSIGNIKEDMLGKVVEAIKKNKDIEYIVNELSYKGVRPSSVVVNELIELASTEILKSRAVDLMVKLINITDNKELAKRVANKHNFNVTGKEISAALNKY
jgi:hypothetical protein